jgi:hypothetical protein
MVAFKITFRGVEIQCETADDAIEIAHRLATSNGIGAGSAHSQSADGSLEVSRYRELVDSLNSSQKKFLSLLVDNPHGKTDHSLRQELDLEGNKALGGMLSGISKLARKVGVSIDTMWSSDRKKVGDEIMREFRVRPELKKISGEIGLK